MIATAERVLRQLRHDPRTIALMLVVPGVLLLLLHLGAAAAGVVNTGAAGGAQTAPVDQPL
jgi:hypothetical protein